MKDFIDNLIAKLEDPNLTKESRELILDILRQQATLEQCLLDKINQALRR